MSDDGPYQIHADHHRAMGKQPAHLLREGGIDAT